MQHLITQATSHEEAEREAPIAVLPVGSFEQHGAYLPLITDTVVACAIAAEIARSYSVLQLPPITISCSHEHASWRGTVSISAGTLYAVIQDVTESLAVTGVDRLVLINGHGGNYVLSNVVQEANVGGPRMSLFPVGTDWDSARSAAGLVSSGHEDMHAGELETSILLHVAPDLVRDGNDTADHVANDRNHLLTLGMRHYTETGVIGRPSLGSATKGKALLDHLAQRFETHMQVLGG